MKKNIYHVLPLLAIIVLLVNCRKKEWDNKYGRPESLEPPIYQLLKNKGNFNNLLALIEKSGYKETLDGSGFWTFFAPNDEAFSKYFAEKGISSVGGIDSASARAMVQYWLVYNAFEEDRLDDYQATANNTGWTPSAAFRRRTAYYTGFYKDTGVNNKEIVAIASNRNNTTGSLTGNYQSTDYNNKYITYFTASYLNANSLSAADYNYFYPNSQYTGFNVLEARVVNKNMVAENGVIHEVDKVISPLMSIDEYIRTRPEYSSFRAILNRLYANNMVQFIYNADVTRRYQVVSGKNDSVFVKVYSSLLAFSPNNENHLKVEEHDGQKDCWTMFIPNNKAVDDFVNNTLLQYYPSLDLMPADIIADFLNAHMFPTVVWPSKFAVTRNKFSEPARFDPAADVFDRKILSNGIVYGTTKVQVPDVFSTVYGQAYLNPKYSFMTRLLNITGMRVLAAKSNIPVNLILFPDKAFTDSGFAYNASTGDFTYKGSTNGVPDRVARILKTALFFSPYKEKMENITDSVIIKSGDAGTQGDFIKIKRGTVKNADGSSRDTIFTGGLLDFGRYTVIDSVKTASNGKVFYVSDVLTYSEKPVGAHIRNLGLPTTSEYNYFWQYLSNSTIFSTTTYDIAGVSGFSTVFVPNNNAIKQAVKDTVLPGTPLTGVPNFNPSAEADKEKVRRFIQYHILNGATVVADGNSGGSYDTYLKNAKGDALKFFISNSPGSLMITDNFGRTANMINNLSNNLSNRSMVHLINNYLKYNLN